jgi:hypothetical protein
MTPRIRINDRVVHRVYGVATVKEIFHEDGHALIRVVRERVPRRVFLKDCEKMPVVPPKLRVVR